MAPLAVTGNFVKERMLQEFSYTTDLIQNVLFLFCVFAAFITFLLNPFYNKKPTKIIACTAKIDSIRSRVQLIIFDININQYIQIRKIIFYEYQLSNFNLKYIYFPTQHFYLHINPIGKNIRQVL